jgi:penicillin G amidase
VTFCDRSTPTGIREGYDASDHNGVRRPPSAQEISHSVAATIYSVWRNQIIGQTLVATLARRGVALTTPREQQLTALKNLFDNFPTRQGHGASGLDFFDVRGVALAEQRRDIILLCSLADALTALAGPQFADAFNGSTNQSDYRLGPTPPRCAGASAWRRLEYPAGRRPVHAAPGESARHSGRRRTVHGRCRQSSAG